MNFLRERQSDSVVVKVLSLYKVKFKTENLSQNKCMDINVTSMFRTCQAFIPKLLANGGGSIINMASVASSRKVSIFIFVPLSNFFDLKLRVFPCVVLIRHLKGLLSLCLRPSLRISLRTIFAATPSCRELWTPQGINFF